MRGKTGRVYGALMSLLTLTKGLPMAYNRDLQEDRQALFGCIHTVRASTRVMTGCISSMDVLPGPNLQGALLLATELADYLAQQGVPFREAHHVVGRIVRHCEEQNVLLTDLGVEGLQAFHPAFSDAVLVWLDPEQAAERRTSRGGTAWSEVMRQVAQLRASME